MATKERKGRGGRENQESERDKENLYPPRVGCGGGGGAPAKAAAFSSTALVVAMATRALAIPSDIKMPPPPPPPAAGAGVLRAAGWKLCSDTRTPIEGAGHGWLGLGRSFMHHL